MEAPTLLPLLLLLAVKMGRFLESLGNFFTGGDNIPWRDRDIIAFGGSYLADYSMIGMCHKLLLR